MRNNTADLLARPLHPTDDEFISSLSERVFAAYAWRPVRTTAGMIQERGSRAMVAELAGARAGFFVLGFERLGRAYGPFQDPAVARLNAIAVRPDLQGRGIGRFLLEQAEELARAEGAVSMSLMTAETNLPARALFMSAGFIPLFGLTDAYIRRQRATVMTKPL
jgi:ribosomal protein S18 acetylase RimI-like enzyme